jgi:hypothetical protein
MDCGLVVGCISLRPALAARLVRHTQAVETAVQIAPIHHSVAHNTHHHCAGRPKRDSILRTCSFPPRVSQAGHSGHSRLCTCDLVSFLAICICRQLHRRRRPRAYMGRNHRLTLVLPCPTSVITPDRATAVTPSSSSSHNVYDPHSHDTHLVHPAVSSRTFSSSAVALFARFHPICHPCLPSIAHRIHNKRPFWDRLASTRMGQLGDCRYPCRLALDMGSGEGYFTSVVRRSHRRVVLCRVSPHPLAFYYVCTADYVQSRKPPASSGIYARNSRRPLSRYSAFAWLGCACVAHNRHRPHHRTRMCRSTCAPSISASLYAIRVSRRQFLGRLLRERDESAQHLCARVHRSLWRSVHVKCQTSSRDHQRRRIGLLQTKVQD